MAPTGAKRYAVELPEVLLDERKRSARTRTTALRSDAIFGDLAHALVNALNTIVAGSELARMMIARSETDAIAQSLDSIENECMRAARLLRDGGAFLAYTVQPPQDGVDVGQLLAACAVPFGDKVRIEASGTIPTIRGDGAALRRMLVEILHNAFQFGAGRVDVRLRPDSSGRGILIDIHDDGPGIKASAERIFEPFFSTNAAESSGLGLSFAAKIAAAHGGSVVAIPAAQGATFRVTLPAGGG